MSTGPVFGAAQVEAWLRTDDDADTHLLYPGRSSGGRPLADIPCGPHAPSLPDGPAEAAFEVAKWAVLQTHAGGRYRFAVLELQVALARVQHLERCFPDDFAYSSALYVRCRSTRAVGCMYSAKCPCLGGADRCMQSDGVATSRPQDRGTPAIGRVLVTSQADEVTSLADDSARQLESGPSR